MRKRPDSEPARPIHDLGRHLRRRHRKGKCRGPHQPDPQANLPALGGLVEVHRHETSTMDRQLEVKDGQLESKDRQIEQLHSLLQQAHAGLPEPVRSEDFSLIAPTDLDN